MELDISKIKNNISDIFNNFVSQFKLPKLVLLTLSIIFFLTIFSFPLVSSVEFEMKTEFAQGETLMAVVSGNFLDQITEDNIFFYKEHVRIPVIYDVGKIDEDFYIYAILTGKEQGNYSIMIKDVRYMKGTAISDEDIIKNFTITENTTDFSLKPGFVITQEDFFLEVQNLQEQKITIQIDIPEVFITSEDSLELKSGQIKKINFQLNEEDFNSSFEKINLSSENTDYSVPVFITGINVTEEEKKLEFKFEPGTVEVSMATDSDAKRIIYISNTGKKTENISISVSPLLEPYVEISPETIDDLNEGANQQIEINIISDLEPVIIEGIITATAGNFSTSMTLILNFIKDFIPEEPEEGKVIVTTCSQLEGIICGDEEKCTGETTPTKDGMCCISPATCEEIKKSSTGKIIGWVIVIIVILLLLWFFRKYKKVRPKIDLMKIAKGKK